ncbi:hypothetical protein BASA62_001650 [Batrachochytrium salamandrivorans]|nr:hypothetical protein BASA62_001650 [Batrachochytrium salamandrivorans]
MMDYNGPLLVRRAVGPDTTDLLWKRADVYAEAGASASSDDSSSNQPSGSGELSELYRTSNPVKEPRWPFGEHALTQRPKYILQSDEESIQTVIEKVTEAFEGVFLAAYDSKDTAPFVLMIPKGTTDQQSSIEKIIDMQNSGKRYVEELLGVVEKAISHTVKDPRKMMKGLQDIRCHTAHMRNFIVNMYHLHYMILFSKVWSLENRAYVDVTESYIRQVWSDGDRVSELLDKIERMTDSGMIKPKPVPSIFSSLMSSIKKRLGINDGPPADTTTD